VMQHIHLENNVLFRNAEAPLAASADDAQSIEVRQP